VILQQEQKMVKTWFI